MIQKTNDKPLKEAFEEMLDSYHLRKKYTQQKLIATWEKVMGKTVANRTTKIFFSDKKLFVYLSSSSLRQELLNYKPEIITKLNDAAGYDLITDIIFS